MEIIRLPAKMTAWSNKIIASGKGIGLVPTMGCFHRGHLALMEEGLRRADVVVTSLFVNPMQFGPGEDFSTYPRTFAADCEAAATVGVDVLYAPEPSNLYPEEFQTKISVTKLAKGLCGASRPGHFDGVTTVVAKLFNTVKPGVAIFGQKDFQQLAVIKAMVRDLNWDVEVVGHPIVREADGLAMSSRNRYLNDAERRSSLCLSHSLASARREVKRGLTDCQRLLAKIGEELMTDPAVEVDYLTIVDDNGLEEQKNVDAHSVFAVAVRLGKTRLIDNGYLM